MENSPHITVATVVEREGRFLMVKEKSDGLIVYNQPAGHLEIGESLIAAAQRETLEETAWQVRVDQFLGIYQYTSPLNKISYVRHCFIAEPIVEQSAAVLDSGILEVSWLRIEEIELLSDELRSPMVLRVLQDYLHGARYPLSLINTD
jgi:ADP-ribose pyrophosphatase YjhB (NUDIX family)